MEINSEEYDFPSDRAINNDVGSLLHEHLESQVHIAKEEDVALQFQKMISSSFLRPKGQKSLSLNLKSPTRRRMSSKSEGPVHFADRYSGGLGGLEEFITSRRHGEDDIVEIDGDKIDNDRGSQTTNSDQLSLSLSINDRHKSIQGRSRRKSSSSKLNSNASNMLVDHIMSPLSLPENDGGKSPAKNSRKRTSRSLSARSKTKSPSSLMSPELHRQLERKPRRSIKSADIQSPGGIYPRRTTSSGNIRGTVRGVARASSHREIAERKNSSDYRELRQLFKKSMSTLCRTRSPPFDDLEIYRVDAAKLKLSRRIPELEKRIL